MEVKDVAKAKAVARIRELTGEHLPDNAMLDIQARPCHLPWADSACTPCPPRCHALRAQLVHLQDLSWPWVTGDNPYGVCS